ncbi:MAG TPA: hypothetical protein ENH38_07760 [Nitrospirae bacterium]|nr:hypothetical protein [Nitrospirota bacterium]
MRWRCPVCGSENDEDVLVCICGHQADEQGLKQTPDFDTENDVFVKDISDGTSEHVLENRAKGSRKEGGKLEPEANAKIDVKKAGRHSDEILIKEVDSWKFTLSVIDKCLYIGTPALKAFKLRLTLDDVEGLLESMYKESGIKKTIRKTGLSAEQILGVLSVLDNMIEEKRSKVRIKYTSNEIQAIANLINKKLVD